MTDAQFAEISGCLQWIIVVAGVGLGIIAGLLVVMIFQSAKNWPWWFLIPIALAPFAACDARAGNVSVVLSYNTTGTGPYVTSGHPMPGVGGIGGTLTFSGTVVPTDTGWQAFAVPTAAGVYPWDEGFLVTIARADDGTLSADIACNMQVGTLVSNGSGTSNIAWTMTTSTRLRQSAGVSGVDGAVTYTVQFFDGSGGLSWPAQAYVKDSSTGSVVLMIQGSVVLNVDDFHSGGGGSGSGGTVAATAPTTSAIAGEVHYAPDQPTLFDMSAADPSTGGSEVSLQTDLAIIGGAATIHWDPLMQGSAPTGFGSFYASLSDWHGTIRGVLLGLLSLSFIVLMVREFQHVF